MKHIVKTMSRFLLLGLTAGCGFFALQGNTQAYSPAYAEESSEKQYSAACHSREASGAASRGGYSRGTVSADSGGEAGTHQGRENQKREAHAGDQRG